MLYSIRTALALKCVLRRFTGITRYDIEVLMIIYTSLSPLSYTAIFGYMDAQVNMGTYYQVIKRLQANGYITRHIKHRHVQYQITQDGIKLLYEFNLQLELAVRDMYDKWDVARKSLY